MSLHLFRKVQTPIHHGTHQVDAAARAVIFVAGFHVRWAGGRAQAAMDAVEKPFVRYRLTNRGWLGFRLAVRHVYFSFSLSCED